MSLFEHSGTAIPAWVCRMWDIPGLFNHCSSKRNPDSEVTLSFAQRKFEGWLTVSSKGRAGPRYRLWFGDDLTLSLKRTFLMSYMRSLEGKLTASKSVVIEKKIPFWEFLDIEFDSDQRVFKLSSYYYQEPSFPELFSRLIGSPALQKVDDELHKKGPKRVYKQGWKNREELEYEIGAKNVIYTLIDTERKLIYVGEATDLVKRLTQGHPIISNWNYFRYNVLPESLAPFRVDLERMAIRDMAELLRNKKGIDFLNISDYQLVNEKVDIR